jgi:hypothetical protein
MHWMASAEKPQNGRGLGQARELDRSAAPASQLHAQAVGRFGAVELQSSADDQAPEPDEIWKLGLLIQRQLLDWRQVREVADVPDPTASVDPHALERRDVGTGEVMQQLGDRSLAGPRRAADQDCTSAVRNPLDGLVDREGRRALTHVHRRRAALANAHHDARAALRCVLADSVIRHG